jgi:hypothetical protein
MSDRIAVINTLSFSIKFTLFPPPEMRKVLFPGPITTELASIRVRR